MQERKRAAFSLCCTFPDDTYCSFWRWMQALCRLFWHKVSVDFIIEFLKKNLFFKSYFLRVWQCQTLTLLWLSSYPNGNFPNKPHDCSRTNKQFIWVFSGLPPLGLVRQLKLKFRERNQSLTVCTSSHTPRFLTTTTAISEASGCGRRRRPLSWNILLHKTASLL